MKCSLIVGHKPNSPGAVNKSSGLTEFDFNFDLADRIRDQVTGVDILIVYRDTYKALPDMVNADNPDFSVAMHCNAYNTKARGCEVLYYYGSGKSRALAELFQKSFVGSLPVLDRGVKSKRSEDRGGYLLVNTKSPCIIAEPFFIDNDDELEAINKNYDCLVAAYAKGIANSAEYLRED